MGVTLPIIIYAYTQIALLDGTDNGWLTVCEFYGNIGVGLFCSSVLALVIEIYHHIKEESFCKQTRSIIFKPLLDAMHDLEHDISLRCEDVWSDSETVTLHKNNFFIYAKEIEIPKLRNFNKINNRYGSNGLLFISEKDRLRKLSVNEIRNDILPCEIDIMNEYTREWFKLDSILEVVRKLPKDVMFINKIIEPDEEMILKCLCGYLKDFKKYLNLTRSRFTNDEVIDNYEKIIDELIKLKSIIDSKDNII